MQTQYILLVSSALKNLVTIFAMSKRLFSARDNIIVDNIKEKPTFLKKKTTLKNFFKKTKKITSCIMALFQMSKIIIPQFHLTNLFIHIFNLLF